MLIFVQILTMRHTIIFDRQNTEIIILIEVNNITGKKTYNNTDKFGLIVICIAKLIV